MSQLHTHMLDNELLDPYQSAYKPQHGTETALLKVKNEILCALDNRKAVFFILLDLSAAFDKVDFDIFDKRLTQCFGIHGNVNKANAKRSLACCPRDKQLAGNGFKFTDPCSLTMGSS